MAAAVAVVVEKPVWLYIPQDGWHSVAPVCVMDGKI
jgi:hypothetical protein